MEKSRVLFDRGQLFGETFMAHDFNNPMHIRLTVTLDRDIDDEKLALAWEKTKRVYPLIDSVLGYEHGDDVTFYMAPGAEEKYGRDHFYFVKPEKGESVPIKSKIPVAPGSHAAGGRLVCVSYFENKIAVNAFHTFVDGGGLNMIISTFLYTYMKLVYGGKDDGAWVELREGRKPEEYYTVLSPEYLFTKEYNKVPLYTLPLNCRGFYDDDMINDEGRIYSGTLDFKAEDFMNFCRENGANPSSMLCVLMSKVNYSIHPEEKRDIVYALTVNNRKNLGLENVISNTLNVALTYVTREDALSRTVAETAGRIKEDVASQRTLDHYLSSAHVFETYRYKPLYKDRVVTYMGKISFGENTGHITDISIGTNGRSNLYMLQFKDRFILIIMYGKATEKYMDGMKSVLEEQGIKTEVRHPVKLIEHDAKEAVF